jgi:outer membrane biosynthesis protein TonB
VVQAPGPPSKKYSLIKNSPPPPASQAAQAITVDQEAPTEEVIPVAFAERYPGGQTHPRGTSQEAIFDLNADPDGILNGTGTGGSGGGNTLAHPAETDWHCPWPSKAHNAGIEQARVHLVVRVTADGRANSVSVLDDPLPGFGFPEATRECAMRQRYKPAKNWRNQAIDWHTGRFATIFYTF